MVPMPSEHTFETFGKLFCTVGSPSETIRPSESEGTGADGVLTDWLDELAGEAALSAEAALRRGDLLGMGGMGQVHVATQRGLDREVAVKSLRDEHIGRKHAVRRLLREARITGQLAHPGVPTVHVVALDADSQPHVVLERIRGREWSKLLADPALPEDDPLRFHLQVLTRVCDAVAYAHAQGVVHRDLKPDNVMVGAFGEVYVLDWGIAVRTDGPVPRMAGTPRYMAPEMLRGEAIHEATDVYLLGGLLYEVLSGRAPHQGQELETLAHSISTFVPQLADAPAELSHLCRRAMHPDPAERLDSATALREGLEAFLAHQGSASIAARAGEQAARVLALLEAEEPDAQQVFSGYSAARFGYTQALDDWPGNGAASAGLHALQQAVASFTLDTGDERAAMVILAEMTDPPPALLDRAEGLAGARLERSTRLDALEADFDPSRGQRTRVFTGLVLGTLWTLAPWLGHAFPGWRTYEGLLVVDGALMVLTVGLGIWARDSLSKSTINRTFIQQSLVLPPAMALLQVGGMLLGMELTDNYVLHPLLFGVMLSLVSISLERLLLIPSAAYLLGFLFAARDPDLLIPILSACNLLLTITLLAAWLPGLREQGILKRRDTD